MFVTIRRYSPQNGAINKASLELLGRQIENDFLPLARGVPGFHGYYVASVGDRELVTLSLSETREAAIEANRRAAEYTLKNPLIFELGCPEVIEGPMLTYAVGAAGSGERNGADQVPGPTPVSLWTDQTGGMLLPASER